MRQDDVSPDQLAAPCRNHILFLVREFWIELDKLADFIADEEHLLAGESIGRLRTSVLGLVLALNGIRRPDNTRGLNAYLGPSQQMVLEKTLLYPAVGIHGWIGQAIALVVIYRWYAPQLAAQFEFDLPNSLETEIWERICSKLPAWPVVLSTDDVNELSHTLRVK